MEITSILIVRLMIIGIYFVLSNFSSFFFLKMKAFRNFARRATADNETSH